MLTTKLEAKPGYLSSSVVRGSQCSEPLLSSGVPDLHLDPKSLHVHSLDLEVHAYCGNEGCVERVIDKSQNQAGFSCTRIPDEEHFKEIVML